MPHSSRSHALRGAPMEDFRRCVNFVCSECSPQEAPEIPKGFWIPREFWKLRFRTRSVWKPLVSEIPREFWRNLQTYLTLKLINVWSFFDSSEASKSFKRSVFTFVENCDWSTECKLGLKSDEPKEPGELKIEVESERAGAVGASAWLSKLEIA